jgi:hypothetical protein
MGIWHRKVISVSGACFCQFKNLKRKLYNCYANIYFTYVIRFYLIFLTFYKLKKLYISGIMYLIHYIYILA